MFGGMLAPGREPSEGNAPSTAPADGCVASGFPLSDTHSVVTLRRRAASSAEPARERQPRALHFCLDNSGSMGGHSEGAKQSFAQLLDLATAPSSFTVFDTEATVLGDALTSARQMRALDLPHQGCTNIGAGVEAMAACVAKAEARAAAAGAARVHHVMVLLTDGSNNSGQDPLKQIPRLAKALRFEHPGAHISVVVIGVSRASKTDLGMVAKTSFETVQMGGMPAMFFCQTMREMEATLAEVQEGFRRFDQTHLTRIACPDGSGCRFVQDAAGEASAEASAFLEAGGACTLLVEGPLPATLLVDGARVPVAAAPFDAAAAAAAMEALLERLKQRRVAGMGTGHGADADVRAQARAIEPWIAMLETQMLRLLPADGAAVPAASATPRDRLRRYKKKLSAEISEARRLRNELAAIVAFESNDSSSQAAFLTGSSSKYAAKAMARSGAVAVDAGTRAAELAASLRKTAARMPRALRADALLALARLPAAAAAALRLRVDTALLDVCVAEGAGATNPECLRFLDADLPEALEAVQQQDNSWLSILTHREQLAEWAEAFEGGEGGAQAPGSEYEALCFLGMHAHPVRVRRCAATQMSPYQMQIERVWPSPVDTCSLLTALKCGEIIQAPEGGDVEDVLPLIDPSCPNSSALVARCALMDIATSITCCRDLHMFLGNEQRMALHAHALLAVLREPPTFSTARLALKIVYSARRHLGKYASNPECRYVVLLRRLLDWDTLTEADGCDHPAQVLLALCVVDRGDPALGLPALTQPALYNLCNEALSRAARGELKGATDGSASAMRAAAATKAMALLGVARDSSPAPTAVELPEPERAAVIEACGSIRPSYTLAPRQQDETRAFCEQRLAETARGVEFARGLHHYCSGGGGGGGLEGAMAELEAGSEQVVGAVLGHMQEAFGRPDIVATLLGLGDGDNDDGGASATAGGGGSETVGVGSRVVLTGLNTTGLNGLHGTVAGPLANGRFPVALADRTAQIKPANLAAAAAAADRPASPSAGEGCRAASVFAAMQAQAYLCHCSQARTDLDDVRDTETLHAITVQLRMGVYDQLMAVKMSKWTLISGDVIVQRAMQGGADEFRALIGTHAHRLNSNEFWSLWHHAECEHGAKRDAFLSMANQEFRNKHAMGWIDPSK